MLDLLAIFLLVLIPLWYLKTFQHPNHFPPGPRRPLPILGDGYILGSDMFKGFQKLQKRYGDIFGLWLGSQRTVVVSDFDTLQDLLNKPQTANRITVQVADLLRRGTSYGSTPGVLFSSGITWVEMRRTSLHILRDFGMGKCALEDMIEDEVENLLTYMEQEHMHKPVDVRRMFNISSLSSLWKIISGETLTIGDTKLEYLIEKLQILLLEVSRPLISAAMNFRALFYFLNWTGLSRIWATQSEVNEFCHQVIREHKSKNDEFDANCPLSFTEAMLSKIKSSDKGGEQVLRNPDLGELNLMNVLVDFFIAGSDTTSNTLNWAMLYMAQNPDVLKRVQRELDIVASTTGTKVRKMNDRRNTPYTQATLHEIQRKGNILPMAVFHYTNSDVECGVDYIIPSNTLVVPFIGQIMNDPSHFPAPEKFDPERYLARSPDGSGLTFTPHARVIPFGIGKRRCLGEVLARTSLYKFFTAIVQKFDIIKAGHPDVPLLDQADDGFTKAPVPYKIIFKLRQC